MSGRIGAGLLIGVNLAGKIAAVFAGRAAPGPALALWFLPDALVAYHLFVPRAQGLVRMHRRFVTTQREVWLTIDDGPDPEDTPRILALLAAHDARATFFMIGKKAAAHPELVRAVVAAGHEVAHHTQTHPLHSFWCASPGRVARELDDGLAALGGSGVRPTRFRPPAGLKNLWLGRALVTRGLVCVGWSARGLERRRGEVQDVVERVTGGLWPGAILLLHEGPAVPAAIRVEAIGRVLERLQQLGYRCVVPSAEQLTG
jgi:peptidoglycan/xylan/chitin deacetylase (PgdA/CDA1 family)